MKTEKQLIRFLRTKNRALKSEIKELKIKVKELEIENRNYKEGFSKDYEINKTKSKLNGIEETLRGLLFKLSSESQSFWLNKPI